jgi:hypothetical protein
MMLDCKGEASSENWKNVWRKRSKGGAKNEAALMAVGPVKATLYMFTFFES